MKKRLLALFLCIAMLAGLTTGMTAEAVAGTDGTNAGQIENDGGSNTATGIIGTGNDAVVTVSKTIEPTDIENYFDITLEIDVKPSQKEYKPTDVVLVMDISNTMNSDGSVKDGKSRMAEAKSAATKFVTQYQTAIANGLIDSDSQFGLVTFNTHASTVTPLTEVTASSLSGIKSDISGIIAPNRQTGRDAYNEKFTNIEGGLQLAYNLLAESDATYKYVILLTDGFPTTYIKNDAGNRSSKTRIVGYNTIMKWEDGYDTYNASLLNTDGYFADAVAKLSCLEGVDYSDKGATKAQTLAASMKADNINIFSIGFDLGSQSIAGYLNKITASGNKYSTVQRTGTTYVIGEDASSYRRWLEQSIAGGPNLTYAGANKYSDGNKETELDTAFSNILRDIELAPVLTMRTAFTLDPMSEDVEFLHFYDKNGNKVYTGADGNAKLVGQSKQHEENSATFTAAGQTDGGNYGQINWDMMTSGYTLTADGHYSYKLSYGVRLKNEVEGFDANTALVTNGKTVFHYETTTDRGEEITEGSVEFPVPQVEGYLGTLVFDKVNALDHTQKLNGTVFELHHEAAGCTICNGDAVIENVTASSDANGRVVINNIPSGHEYLLVEIQSAEDYYVGHTHEVEVKYGQTYLYSDVSLQTEINESEFIVTEDNPGVVENQNIPSAEVNLSVIKELTGAELEEGQFDFVVIGSEDNPLPYNHYMEGISNKADGTAAFTTLYFNEMGRYEFSIYESKGTDSNILYDDAVHKIEIMVTGVTEYGEVNNLPDLSNLDETEEETTSDETEEEITTSETEEEVTSSEAEEEVTSSEAEEEVTSSEAEEEVTSGEAEEEVTSSETEEEVTSSEAEEEVTSSEAEEDIPASIEPESRVIVGNPESGSQESGDNGKNLTADNLNQILRYKARVFIDEKEVSVLEEKNGVWVATVPAFQFKNETRASGEAYINAIKSFIDVDTGETLNPKGFEFQLIPEGGDPIKAISDENGNVSFGPFTYNQEGAYVYTLSEVLTDNTDILYDASQYEVTVTVTAPGDDGAYVTKVSYDKLYHDGEEGDISDKAPLFTNYKRGDAILTLEGLKTLDGKAPGAKQFKFTIKEIDGDYTETVTNDADGVIQFTPLHYHEVDAKHNYMITEEAIDEKGIIIDKTVYHLYATTRILGGTSSNIVYAELSTLDEAGNKDNITIAYGSDVSITVDDSGEHYIAFDNKTDQESETPGDTEPETPEQTESEKETESTKETKPSEGVSTGDKVPVVALVTVMVVSVQMMIFAFVMMRKKR